DVGGVEEVDPQLERAVHDRERVPFAGLGPEVHRPEAEPTDLQRRPTEPDVIHAPNLAARAGDRNRARPGIRAVDVRVIGFTASYCCGRRVCARPNRTRAKEDRHMRKQSLLGSLIAHTSMPPTRTTTAPVPTAACRPSRPTTCTASLSNP